MMLESFDTRLGAEYCAAISGVGAADVPAVDGRRSSGCVSIGLPAAGVDKTKDMQIAPANSLEGRIFLFCAKDDRHESRTANCKWQRASLSLPLYSALEPVNKSVRQSKHSNGCTFVTGCSKN